MIKVTADPQAHEEVWHAPVQPAMTLREFMNMIASRFGTELKFRTATPLIQKVMGIYNPNIRALGESMYQYTRPFLVDDSKYCRACGDSASPLQQTIDETIRNEGLDTSGTV